MATTSVMFGINNGAVVMLRIVVVHHYETDAQAMRVGPSYIIEALQNCKPVCTHTLSVFSKDDQRITMSWFL